MAIKKFDGEFRWLSNFWPALVVYEGETYPSVENAYQAAKFSTAAERVPFKTCTAGKAKRLAKQAQLREAWNDEKYLIMRGLIQQKFNPGSELAEKLLGTGGQILVEGNHWGDTYWGICNGVGRNKLGLLLMEQRDYLQMLNSSALPTERK